MANIRHYREADIPVLEQLVARLHEAMRPYDRCLAPTESIRQPHFAYLRARVRETGGTFFVAEDNGSIVGYLCLFGRVAPGEPDQTPEPYAEVSEIYVVPAYQGRDIGAALMRAAEAYARSLGVGRVELAVLAENRAAIGFYRKLGYAERIVVFSRTL